MIYFRYSIILSLIVFRKFSFSLEYLLSYISLLTKGVYHAKSAPSDTFLYRRLQGREYESELFDLKSVSGVNNDVTSIANQVPKRFHFFQEYTMIILFQPTLTKISLKGKMSELMSTIKDWNIEITNKLPKESHHTNLTTFHCAYFGFVDLEPKIKRTDKAHYVEANFNTAPSILPHIRRIVRNNLDILRFRLVKTIK